RRQPFPDLGMLALVRRDRCDLGGCLRVVGRFLVTLERLHEIGHSVRPEHSGDGDDEPNPQPRRVGRRHIDAQLAQLRGPDIGVTPLVGGDRPKRGGALVVLFDRRQRVVQDDRVALELEVFEALTGVDGGHPRHRSRGSSRAARTLRQMSVSSGYSLSLRYLNAADVAAAMPPLAERIKLAEQTMTGLATPGAADLPPKIGVHPRPDGSFAHAMPAHLRGEANDGSADLLGMKWI